jgi:lipoprotein NlpI
MLGYLDDAKLDMDKSMVMAPSNSYNYRNQGVYLFMKGEFEEALHQFLTAKEMDPDTYEIENWIDKAKQALTENNNT